MRRSTIFWGCIFIGLGFLVLLDNLDIISINVWELIWPFFLISVGLWVLLGAMAGKRAGDVEHAVVPLEGASQANIRFNHGAGRLRISGITAPDTLLEGDFGGGVEISKRQEGDALDVTLSMPSKYFPDIPWLWGANNLDWIIRINDQTQVSLNLNTGAAESKMDFSNTQVKDIRLKTGASSTDLVLPSNAGQVYVKVEAGVASVKIQVPPGVAARVRDKSGLSSLSIDRSRFPRQKSVFQSPDYDTAQNKVEIDVQTGVGSVEIR